MNKNITLGWLAVILSFLFAIPVIAYLINFHSASISGKSDDWSNFAGFIGDILSPLLNIGNILVVYYLALRLNSIEENRETQNLNLEAQRRINDFRYNAYKEVSAIVFELIKSIMPGASPNVSPILIVQFKYTIDSHSRLFTTLGSLNRIDLQSRLTNYANLDRPEKLRVIGDLNDIMNGIITEIGFI